MGILLDRHETAGWKNAGESWEEVSSRVVTARLKDWFLDAIDTLMPLVTAKRRAYCRFLHAHTTSSKKEFRQNQRIVKEAMDEAKEA